MNKNCDLEGWGLKLFTGLKIVWPAARQGSQIRNHSILDISTVGEDKSLIDQHLTCYYLYSWTRVRHSHLPNEMS